MLNKGLWLACAMALLSACDSSSDKPAPAPAPTEQAAPVAPAPAPAEPAAPAAAPAPAATPAPTQASLGERYAGRELTVVDVSEVQVDGASALSVTFSVPLDKDQNLAERVHLVDTTRASSTAPGSSAKTRWSCACVTWSRSASWC